MEKSKKKTENLNLLGQLNEKEIARKNNIVEIECLVFGFDGCQIAKNLILSNVEKYKKDFCKTEKDLLIEWACTGYDFAESGLSFRIILRSYAMSVAQTIEYTEEFNYDIEPKI